MSQRITRTIVNDLAWRLRELSQTIDIASLDLSDDERRIVENFTPLIRDAAREMQEQLAKAKEGNAP